jgi:hypothetical protein
VSSTKGQLVLLVLLIVAAFTVGCRGLPFGAAARSDPEPSTTCPFGIRGTRVQMEDTRDGVVLSLHAFGDVEDVRRRARDAAAMYGPGARMGLGHGGAHGKGEQHGLGLVHLGVPVNAMAEDTPEGARIFVWPKRAEDVGKMRAALVERERRTRTGECP